MQKRTAMPTPQIIGYWYSKHTPEYPMPEAQVEPWEGQDKFLAALASKERNAVLDRYRGWSQCRICNCNNGSTEYASANYRWPSGLRHYVEEHNVRIDESFVKWVVGS